MSGIDYSILNVYTENPQDGLSIRSRVYQGTLNLTGGTGGWQSVARPQNNPISVWRGPQNVFTMEIPMVFNVYDHPTGDIEAYCQQLQRMAGILTIPVVQPPLLVLDANGGIPNDVWSMPNVRWVIPEDGITWGEQLRNDAGRRSQQMVTVKFMKYTAYDELTRSKQTNQGQPRNTTTAKGGETYNKIAARALKQYGGVKWGNRLAQLNGAKDGAASPQPGTLVRLPTSQEISQWQHTSRR